MERREEETHVERDEAEGTVHNSESRVTRAVDEPAVADTRVVTSVAPAQRAVEMVYLLFGIVDGFLLVRLLLKVMAANANVPFTGFIYGVSEFFLLPFRGLLPSWVSGRSILEPSVMVAILVYALIAYAVARLLAITLYRNVTVSHRRRSGMRLGAD